MVIQKNTNIVATTYDLILVQNFHLQIKAGKKCHFFGAEIRSSVHIDNMGDDIS